MGGEWREYKIGDLGRIVTGKTPSTKIPKYFGGQYPFITIPDMGTSVYVSETARSLSQAGAEVMKSCQLPKSSVMMSCIATIGKCGITTKDSFTNQQINSVICDNNKVYPLYLYYVFTQLGCALDAAGGGGSVYTNVSKSRFSDISVVTPPLPEQRAIAHILGSLDDKIELNRRMNQTLEAVARAIFKSWFVHFDPVRAKAEGRPTGLPDDIDALFPDSFENSELGEIPKGWEVGVVGHIGGQARDGIKPEEMKKSEYYIALEHMPKRSISLWNWTNSGGITSGKFRFKKGNILFGKLRPYFQKVGVPAIDGVCSTDIVVIVPKEECFYGLLLGHLSSDDFIAYTNAASTGTKMPRTNWNDMSRYPVVLPDAEILTIFTKNIKHIVNKLHENIHESNTLASLRDTLLPKLIAGEVRIPDAEKFLEEAV